MYQVNDYSKTMMEMRSIGVNDQLHAEGIWLRMKVVSVKKGPKKCFFFFPWASRNLGLWPKSMDLDGSPLFDYSIKNRNICWITRSPYNRKSLKSGTPHFPKLQHQMERCLEKKLHKKRCRLHLGVVPQANCFKCMENTNAQGCRWKLPHVWLGNLNNLHS
jgi:hypothetical protein